MITFENKIITSVVNKLLTGKNYRTDILNYINIQFLDFSIQFFKDILQAKLNNNDINLDWYKTTFITNNKLSNVDIVNNAGINLKTLTNLCGSTKKEIVLNIAETNYDYLKNLINELNEDNIENNNENINIQIKIEYNKISVELNLAESLLVINALATKKISLRGGAWSAIGKNVEKPLMLKLCKLCKVNSENINSEVFKRDKNLKVDREVDFKLYSDNKAKEYRCEIKLSGKGNPESYDAVVARNTDIFIADAISEQAKNHLDSLNIKWLELKNKQQKDIIKDFKIILKDLEIPFRN